MLDELFKIDFAIVVQVNLANDWIKLVRIFTSWFVTLKQGAYLPFVDQPIIVIIKQLEGLLQLCLAIIAGYVAGKGNKLAEGDTSILVQIHTLEYFLNNQVSFNYPIDLSIGIKELLIANLSIIV